MNFLHKYKRRLPLITLLCIGITLYTLYGEHITLKNFQQHKEILFTYKEGLPFLSAFLYICFYAFCTFLSLPFGTLFAILGGYLFGTFQGLFIVTIGATIGACGVFLISKYSLKGVVPKRLQKPYNKVKNKFEEGEISYLFFLRLVPLFPFSVVNILPAFFNVPLRIYALTTFLGIIPGTFAHTYLGSAFEEMKTLNGIISPKAISAFVLLGLLSLLPLAINIYKKKKVKK